MEAEALTRALAEQLPFAPTVQQAALGSAMVRWCARAVDPREAPRVFILNGYAGTGKTSVVGALVRALAQEGAPSVLLASTGRAAKVLAEHTGLAAHTIHRKIYRPSAPGSGDGGFVAAQNQHVDTFFIVDEASMIGSGVDAVLEDLVSYVYSGSGCRLILVGDTAQLPPVGTDISPAMDAEALRKMGLKVTRAEITETVRQKQGSGILYNATLLRRAMGAEGEARMPELRVRGFGDVSTVEPTELADALSSAYGRYGAEGTIVITGSNRRAVGFNQAIRKEILDREAVLVAGERLIVAKNNYFWTRPNILAAYRGERDGGLSVAAEEKGEVPPGRLPDFLANGEVVEVVRVIAMEERADIRFADVELTLGEGMPTFAAKIVVDALEAEDPGLPAEIERELAYMAYGDAGIDINAGVSACREAMRKSPYYNALRVKYAYAVTCHKAQGGQWPCVFVDPTGLAPGLSTLRWMYTAVTRATRKMTMVRGEEG